jgi:hypothetical protein
MLDPHVSSPVPTPRILPLIRYNKIKPLDESAHTSARPLLTSSREEEDAEEEKGDAHV